MTTEWSDTSGAASIAETENPGSRAMTATMENADPQSVAPGSFATIDATLGAVIDTAIDIKAGAVPRVDGRLKVTGEARYGADFMFSDIAHACLATSAIAKGRVAAIDDSIARGIPGVLEVFTHRNVGDAICPGTLFSTGGYMGMTVAPLQADRVWNDGQIVAMVVADSLEAAREGVLRLAIRYEEQAAAAGFDSAGAETVAVAEVSQQHKDPCVGDAAGAFARAPVKIDARYSTPTQHHNPMELFATTCAWQGEQLTVWESSQSVWGYKHGLADQLGISPEQVRIIPPYVGGAFGSRGALTQRTALVALAARRLGRPVKLVAERDQGYTIASYRAETRHRVRLAAERDGRLAALSHEGWEVTSRADDYAVAGTATTTRIYNCPNISSRVHLTRADRNTPGFMRSPPELPYMFALESAMDELACELDMDPVELRRINDTCCEPIGGRPFTSRSLMQCFDLAGEAFGWSHRDPRPGSMRDGDWLLGWGCATAVYPTHIAPSAVRIRLTGDGRARVGVATHDLGTGTYTVVAVTAAELLGLPLENIQVEIGDSDLPPAPIAGGSNTTASVCHALAKGCEELCFRLATAAVAADDSPLHGADPAALRLVGGDLRDPQGRRETLANAMARIGGVLEIQAENLPVGLPEKAGRQLYRGKSPMTGGMAGSDHAQAAFGAEFVELRIHARTRELRCSRAVGAFAAGRIISPRTAHSQLMGGMIWGISSALHEATDIDRHSARYYNDDLAEYLIPVNADVRDIEVILVSEQDHQVNPLGIKGLGELGNVGTNAAIANAVFHATGKRVRELPIRLEQLL